MRWYVHKYTCTCMYIFIFPFYANLSIFSAPCFWLYHYHGRNSFAMIHLNGVKLNFEILARTWDFRDKRQTCSYKFPTVGRIATITKAERSVRDGRYRGIYWAIRSRKTREYRDTLVVIKTFVAIRTDGGQTVIVTICYNHHWWTSTSVFFTSIQDSSNYFFASDVRLWCNKHDISAGCKGARCV